MNCIPNTISILGSGSHAADVAIRSVLKFKEKNGSVIVLDFTGRGALVLKEENKMGLLKHNVLWCNLADRLRPVGIFTLARSVHFQQVMLRVLKTIRRISRIQVNDTTLVWATEAAFMLSKNGTIGLAALMKSLSSPETRRWFLSTQGDPHDLGQLLSMISWCLRFPSVYAASEGINRADFESAVCKEGAVWIESPLEYFEQYEYQIISCLLDAAIENSIKNAISQNKAACQKITVLHLFPPESGFTDIPEWIKETSNAVKHIFVHKLPSERPMNTLLNLWSINAATVWIVGKVLPLKKSAHINWLTDKEIEKINSLNYGNVWIKSNDSGKAITANVKYSNDTLGLAYTLRQKATLRRKISPVRQMATSVLSGTKKVEEYNLYNRLSEKETLRLGWLRVQTARKDSYGTDKVTIAEFKANAESELAKLSEELKSKTYRCKPLRKVQIPKPDGDKREIRIASVRDRVVISSCLLSLEPIFEPVFSHFSFAFRPNRSAHHALAVVRSMIATGKTWVVTADIRKCFDSIDHNILMRLIARRIGDADIINLIKHWLTIDIIDFDEMIPIITGVPQGESLSPLLANIYLDPLDKHFEQLGISFVRYADDIIILTSSKEDAEQALKVMSEFLFDPLRLELKPAKTNYVALSDGFDYLGFSIREDGIRIKQNRTVAIQDILRGYVMTLGNLSSTLEQRSDARTNINATIRGWRNYFALPDEPHIAEQMKLLDESMEQMAHYYLPLNIRDDPAWICRERFIMPKGFTLTESEEKELEKKSIAGIGYPEPPTNVKPAGWMIKDDQANSGRDVQKNRALVVEDHSDNELENENMNNSLIEDGDRLYVLTHGSYLTVMGDDLVIRQRKIEVHRRSLSELGLVFLQGFGINISVNLQLRLAELDVPVVLAPPVGEPMAVLTPISTSKSYLRSLQVLRRDDPDVVATGLSMIASKIGNQAAVLRYFAKYRKKTSPDIARQLIKTADTMRGLADNALLLDPSTEEVRSHAMGFEGQAAAFYWRQLAKILPETTGFTGRITRSAQDPINQSLNYIYGMLYGEVWRAVVRAGLDPYFGIIHGSQRDQGSLVFDLIEEFRAPFADRLVVGMLGRGFRPETGQQGFLKTRTKRQLALCFSKKWSKKLSWRSHAMEPSTILAKQANSLAKLFNRAGDYHPYKMRW